MKILGKPRPFPKTQNEYQSIQHTMKKLALTLSIIASSYAMAQYHPNTRWDNHGTYGTQYGYGHDFPDDYYYEYPSDYYDEAYYRSVYNDYQQSISMVNWNAFFRQHRLAPTQINLIIELNREYPSYHAWNARYRMNPKRWWYDRFYALERILGSQIFIIFQNNYYHGYSPVRYYDDYWRDHYYPYYRVAPQYRRVHIDHYRVPRTDYYRQKRTYTEPVYQQPAPSRTGSFRTYPVESSPSYPRNDSFRGNSNSSNHGNIRSGGFGQSTQPSAPRSGNTSSGNRTGGFR